MFRLLGRLEGVLILATTVFFGGGCCICVGGSKMSSMSGTSAPCIVGNLHAVSAVPMPFQTALVPLVMGGAAKGPERAQEPGPRAQ